MDWLIFRLLSGREDGKAKIEEGAFCGGVRS